jgi:hypothetical protein
MKNLTTYLLPLFLALSGCGHLVSSNVFSSRGSNVADEYPIPFESNRRWGAKDKNGATVIPPIYKNVLLFKGGISIARTDGKIGYIDQAGNVAIPFEYDRGLNLSHGLVGVCAEGQCGYLDAKGNTVIPLIYKEVNYFSAEEGGLAIVKGGLGWGVIDTAGREIIAPRLESRPSISEGFIIASDGKRTGMISDLKGNKLISLNYDVIAYNVWAGKYLNDNLFTVALDGKWGFIDKAGKVVIPPRYDKRAFFYKGQAEVVRDGKIYRIDKRGTETQMGDWQPATP